jgi:chromosome segregation ATPase
MEGMFRLAEGVRAMQREFTQTLLGAGRPAVPAAVTGEAAPRVTAVEQARVLERARQEQQAAEVQARKAQAEAAQARKALAAAERRAAEAERREEGTLELAVALEKTIRELQQEVGELQHEREAAEPARRAAKHTAKETGRSERARQKEPIRQTGRPPDEAEATTPATPQAEAERTPGAAVDVPSEGSR